MKKKEKKKKTFQNIFKQKVVKVLVGKKNYNVFNPFYNNGNYYKSSGSGFFITYEETPAIITNYHVVSSYNLIDDNKPEIKIQLNYGEKKKIPVQLERVYPERDLALLTLTKENIALIEKIYDKKISPLELANSDDVDSSETILAIGNPLGEDNITITRGIYSGKSVINGFQYLKTTAAISPGNSGGPSVIITKKNNYKVIGVNTLNILGFNGVYHIVPSNDVKKFLLYENDRIVRHPMLGLAFQKIDENLKKKVKFIKNATGIRVKNVTKTPNFLDLEEGDILFKINNHRITDEGEIIIKNDGYTTSLTIEEYFSTLEHGEKVEIIYFDGSKQQTKSVIYQPKESNIKHFMIPDEIEKMYYLYFPKIGLVLMDMTYNHLEQVLQSRREEFARTAMLYKLSREKNEGIVFVSHLKPGSEVYEKGLLKTGSIIKVMMYGNNEKKIHNINDIIGHLRKTNNIKYISFKTNDKTLVVFTNEQLQNFEYKKFSINK